MIRARHQARLTGTERVLFEYPLPFWREVGGSKLKLRNFLLAPVELLAIYRHYLSGLRATAPAAPAPPSPYFARRRVAARPDALKESFERSS
jgi:hypothetical protein